MKVRAVFYEAEEGGYWAKVPALPGVYTQAETIEDLGANLREAVELYLADDSRLDVVLPRRRMGRCSKSRYAGGDWPRARPDTRTQGVAADPGAREPSPYGLDERRVVVPTHRNRALNIGLQRDLMRQAGLTEDDLSMH